jgi:hypothetical protein
MVARSEYFEKYTKRFNNFNKELSYELLNEDSKNGRLICIQTPWVTED